MYLSLRSGANVHTRIKSLSRTNIEMYYSVKIEFYQMIHHLTTNSRIAKIIKSFTQHYYHMNITAHKQHFPSVKLYIPIHNRGSRAPAVHKTHLSTP